MRLCAVEHESWRKPGSVSSSVAVLPPMTGRASRTGIVDHSLKELCRVYVSKTIDCDY
jgi:hypothetical protein